MHDLLYHAGQASKFTIAERTFLCKTLPDLFEQFLTEVLSNAANQFSSQIIHCFRLIINDIKNIYGDLNFEPNQSYTSFGLKLLFGFQDGKITDVSEKQELNRLLIDWLKKTSDQIPFDQRGFLKDCIDSLVKYHNKL